MKKFQHPGKIRKAALGVVASAAIAFTVFFSPNTALAKRSVKDNCSKITYNALVDKKPAWEGKGRTCATLKRLKIYIQKPKDKKTMVVMLDCDHVKTQYEQFNDTHKQMLQNNIDYAQRFYDIGIDGKWHCLGASSAKGRIMPDDTQSSVEKPDATQKVAKPKLTPVDKRNIRKANKQFSAAKKSLRRAERYLKKKNLFKARLALVESTKKVTDGLQSIYPVFDLINPIEHTLEIYPLVQDSNTTDASLKKVISLLKAAMYAANTKKMTKAQEGSMVNEQQKRNELDKLRANVGKIITSGHATSTRRFMPDETKHIQKPEPAKTVQKPKQLSAQERKLNEMLLKQADLMRKRVKLVADDQSVSKRKINKLNKTLDKLNKTIDSMKKGTEREKAETSKPIVYDRRDLSKVINEISKPVKVKYFREGIEGKAFIVFEINPEGKVVKVDVEKNGNDGFGGRFEEIRKHLIRSIKRLKFKPGQRLKARESFMLGEKRIIDM